MKIVAIIPARGGSKGVPEKNIKFFDGKPLIVHSIEQALRAPEISEVYVSTDDSKIAKISELAGSRVIRRPDEISGDTASSESALSHALESIEESGVAFDAVLFLQATSPLRPCHGISDAVKRFVMGGCDSLVSISPTHRFFWQIKDNQAHAEYDYINRPRRQDMTDEDIRYVENGSLYLFTKKQYQESRNRLGGKIGYIVFDEEYSLEIDSLMDFTLLEQIAKDIKVQ